MSEVIETELKELRTEFTGIGEVRGYSFKQIEASHLGFIYEVKHESGSIHYEVFKRKINDQYNCVTYPSSKAFGIYAWTATSLNRVKEIFSAFRESK